MLSGWCRRVTSLVLVGGLLVSSLGLLPPPALVARLLGFTLSERFPCEICACGCFSARQCWTSCCCLTPRQRLAWAVRNGIEPPVPVELEEHRSVQASCCSSSDDAGGSSCPDPAGGPPSSPARCKSISLWLLVGLPPMTSASSSPLALPLQVSGAARIPSDRVPDGATVETPTPPPRRLARHV